MQTLFDELSNDEKRTFLIKNVLKDGYFTAIHDQFKLYSHIHSFSPDEFREYQRDRNNTTLVEIIKKYLDDYEYAVNTCALRESKYSYDVFDILDEKERVEWACISNHINGNLNSKHIFYVIIDYYEKTKKTIDSYEGDDNQTLKKAIKILLSNPFLDDSIKQSKEFLYYSEELKSYKIGEIEYVNQGDIYED